MKEYLQNFFKSKMVHKNNVTNSYFSNNEEALDSIFLYNQQLVESYYPLFLQNQLLNPKWCLKGSRHAFRTMREQETATISWPISKLDWFV